LCEKVFLTRVSQTFLIEPSSDLATWHWLTERSVLPELDPELTQVNKNEIYEIADLWKPIPSKRFIFAKKHPTLVRGFW
jgi:hypothetical protein